MFKRDHHVRIASILESLDADFFRESHCYFGGGTAIALAREEYRESVDIDFVVADSAGYRRLREKVTAKGGIQNIAREGAKLEPLREARVDQYGIRTLLSAGSSEIKFEIILEARISFAPPSSRDRICGVSTLTSLDLAATKLLANSDRWADDSVFSRDLIDLAMLAPSRAVLKSAMEKAEKAYGKSIERDLEKAIEALKDRTGRLEECMAALKMDQIPVAVLWQRIRDLRGRKSRGTS